MRYHIRYGYLAVIFAALLLVSGAAHTEFMNVRLYDTGEQMFTIGQFWGEYDRPLYDFDGDGVGDFFFFSFLTPEVATGFIVYGTSSGGFGESVQTDVQLVPDYDLCQYVILDVNGDGLDDIIVSGWYSLPLYLNTGDGHFSLSSISPYFLIDYNDCWSGGEDFRMHPSVPYDCNGDGREEFMAYPMMEVVECGPCALLMLQNIGENQFSAAATLEGPYDEYCTLYPSMDHKVGYTAGDFNGDGCFDILQATHYSGATIFASGEGCQFSRFYHTTGCLWNVRTGDFNGDGIDDFVSDVESYPGRFIVHYGDPVEITTRAYDGWLAYNIDYNYRLHCVADFDGDGYDDIVVADSTVAGDNYWEIYVHYSAGDTFLSRCDTLSLRSYFSYPQALHLFSDDLNADGRDDLFYIARGDRIGVLLQEGPVATLLQRFEVALDQLQRPRIEWEVSSGADCASFTVSRAVEGGTFTAVSTVAVDPSAVSYSLVDEESEGLAGFSVIYRLAATMSDGSVELLAEDQVRVPRSQLVLHQNVPNPFNPGTVISFALPERAVVSVDIYDVSGRHIRSLIDGERMEEGTKSISWDGRNDTGRAVSTGFYYCRLSVGKQVLARKMLLVR